MRVRLKNQLLIVTAEAEDERDALVAWARSVDGHVFALLRQDTQTFDARTSGRAPTPAVSPSTSLPA